MEDLPAELLSAEILPHCLEYTPALRAVCRAWRQAARGSPPRKTNGLGLKFLARSGDHLLIGWTKDQRGRFMTPQLNSMLRAACRGGHTALARTLLEWGGMVYLDTFRKACKSKQAPLVFELKALIPSSDLWAYFNDGAGSAARYGDYGMVATIADWGSSEVDDWTTLREEFWDKVLQEASYGGHLDVIRLACSQGADAFEPAFCRAAAGGQWALMTAHLTHLRAARMAGALSDAVLGRHKECVRRLLELNTIPDGHTVRLAARSGDPETLDLIVSRADKWYAGATRGRYIDILCGAAAGGHEDLLCRTHALTDWRWALGEVFVIAATHGRVHILRRLHTWYPECCPDEDMDAPAYFTSAFLVAICEGQVDAATLLREWGAVCQENDEFADAMPELALMGNIAMMRLLRKWCEEDETPIEYGSALGGAAEQGEETAMEFLYEWGKKDISLEDLFHALRLAAFEGQPSAMQLLKQWIKEYHSLEVVEKKLTGGEKWIEEYPTLVAGKLTGEYSTLVAGKLNEEDQTLITGKLQALVAGKLTALLAEMHTHARNIPRHPRVKTAEQFLREWLDAIAGTPHRAPDGFEESFAELLAELLGETGASDKQ